MERVNASNIGEQWHFECAFFNIKISAPMLHRTDNLFPPATENTRVSRKGFGQSSTVPSLNSTCPSLVVWERHHRLLQEAHLFALFQTGLVLLQYHCLDQMQPVLFTSSLFNPVNKWCPLCWRLCLQTIPLIDLVPTVELLLIFSPRNLFRILCCLFRFPVLVDPVYCITSTCFN